MNNEYLEVLEEKVLGAMKKNNDEILEKWKNVRNTPMTTEEDLSKFIEIADRIENELKYKRDRNYNILKASVLKLKNLPSEKRLEFVQSLVFD